VLAGKRTLWSADKSGESTAALEERQRMCRNLSLWRAECQQDIPLQFSMLVNEVNNSEKWIAKSLLVSSNISQRKVHSQSTE